MPQLTIECTNFRRAAGDALVIVWDDPAKFRDDDSTKAFRTKKVPVTADTVVVDVGDLPAGTYAIAVLHDENDNDKLDVSPFLQLPTEGVAFSNNPKMGLKGPTWDACAFDLQADTTSSIRLKYWR